MKIFIYLLLLVAFNFQISFATCNTAELNIANAIYNKNHSILAGYSIAINCKAGYVNPESQPSFNIQCNNNSKVREDGTVYKKDEWFFLEDIHVCKYPSSPPSSNSSIALGCFTKDLQLLHGQINTTQAKIASGSFVSVTCNSGYAASSMSLNTDETPNLLSYDPKTSFNVLCLDGRFMQFTSCLTACDINYFRSRLLDVVPNGQVINSTASIAAPGDAITIKCDSGGIADTGLTSYKAYCVLDENCKVFDASGSTEDPSDGKCISRAYFKIQTTTDDLKSVGQKATGEVDITFTNFPTCQPQYRSCNNADILTAVGNNIDSDAMETLQSFSETRHSNAIKVTCSNSSGLANKNNTNFDSNGNAFRIFNCIDGQWNPSPSDLICPAQDCMDNDGCGYPHE